MEMRTYDDRRALVVPEGEVTQLRIDFAVTLVVTAEPEDKGFLVRIGGECTLTAPDDTTTNLTPEGDPSDLAPVLRLARLGVRRTEAFNDGHLEMEFSDGTRLDVPADDDYEAWTATADNGVRIVSMPGGELAVWAKT